MAGLVLVELALIDVDPNNPRGDVGDVTDLKLSIAHTGLQDPLHVIPKFGGRYFLHEGHRRLKALTALGKTHAPAIERAFTTTLDQILAQGTIHAHRRDFNPMAWSRYLYRLFSDHNLNRHQIAHRLGMSPAWVRDHLSFVHLEPDEQHDLEAGNLSRKEALARLADRRAAKQGRPSWRSQGAAPAQRSRSTYFSTEHRLAEQVAIRCASAGLEHAASPKIGGVGCGPCWEATIHAEALNAARPALAAA